MRFPHPLVLLVACVLLAAALSWLLPAGEYQRHDDAATGRSLVVAGTYHHVDPNPVGAFQALVAIPRGMVDAGGVIFYVFLVGGAFAVVERTGASTRLVQWLVSRLEGHEVLMIPMASLAFGLGGIMIQMSEELIAFVPMLLLLTRRLGLRPLVAVSVSLGAAAVGAAFSPVNPFQVVIAQKVADLEPQSGLGFRLLFLVPALLIWIWGTIRFARATAVAPGSGQPPDDPVPVGSPSTVRDGMILVVVLATFVLFILGARLWGWDFPEFSALFFLMGVGAGLVGRLGVPGTAEALVEGFRSMAFAALLIGFARAIYVVLNDGLIVDTIVERMFAPIAQLPLALSAIGMMGAQTLVHVPVPSTSGQAVLTLPVLVPLSDLLGMSRQITVLAYQFGAGLCELLTPTNGSLMAMLAATGVRFEEWLRFTLPLWGLLLALGAAALVLGLALGV